MIAAAARSQELFYPYHYEQYSFSYHYRTMDSHSQQDKRSIFRILLDGVGDFSSRVEEQPNLPGIAEPNQSELPPSCWRIPFELFDTEGIAIREFANSYNKVRAIDLDMLHREPCIRREEFERPGECHFGQNKLFRDIVLLRTVDEATSK
jgi:hypothetical protein